MAIYMQVPGIKGNVTDSEYKDWIELEMIDIGMGRVIDTPVGRSADRIKSSVSASEFTVKKQIDKSSPLLFGQVCVGKAIPEVKICTTHAAGTYLEYTLSNVIFSSYAVNIARKNELNNYALDELLALNFTQLEMRYTPYDHQQKPLSPLAAHVNVGSVKTFYEKQDDTCLMCMAPCVKKNRLNWYAVITAFNLSNPVGNIVAGKTGRMGISGAASHATSWRHKLGGKIARVSKNVIYSHIGRKVGSAAILPVVFEGFYDIGAIGRCYYICQPCKLSLDSNDH